MSFIDLIPDKTYSQLRNELKPLTSEDIERQTKEFLARKGKITACDPGESAEVRYNGMTRRDKEQVKKQVRQENMKNGTKDYNTSAKCESN